MIKSNDNKVQNFLTELSLSDPQLYNVILKARNLVFSTYSNVSEKLMYGGIIFSHGDEMFSGLFAYKHHVSLEFSNGYLFDDPKGNLEGKGKYRRHLKLKTTEEIEIKEVVFYLNQI
ncbi:MAG: DUF1801 domain-containing protein [Saprospiraceae bacterium]|nr:DUF1801 domain-containing protein [Bacteroidia bacterium]NNE14063.1 DUF1801 domain-containing protein [Saprospiraceae bacterium]NNL92862.1 DUF1801 domain-containing protein [Saprospiraceae bacterium]